MRYVTDIHKTFLGLIVDVFEAEIHDALTEDFDKRCSVSIDGGRPYLYSPRELGEGMIGYFRNCVNNRQPFMVTSLCLYIGISREGLHRLGKSSIEQFVDIIKKGRQMIEFYLELQLHLNPNPQGIIFILKNMGWSDNGSAKHLTTAGMSYGERIAVQEKMINLMSR